VQRYIARRILLAIPSLLLVTLFIFSLVRLLPGDVVIARVAEGGFADEEQLAKMRADLGIDRPFVTQYLDYLGGLVRGDLGNSLWTSDPVRSQIASRLGVSIRLAVMALLMAIIIAIPLGIVSAVRRNTWLDYGARFISILGLSLPDFWIATILILALTLWVGWLPEFSYWPIW
jgi:peptide/nickel transport system permease protein